MAFLFLFVPFVVMFFSHKLFPQVSEALLQAGEGLVFARVRALQGSAPLPFPLDLDSPQAKQVSVVDVGFFVHRVHFIDPCFQYTDRTCWQRGQIVPG